jgi:cytochrome P450
MEGDMRDFCRELLAALDGCDRADAAEQYSQHLPVHVIARMIGVPEDDADVFRDWVYRNFQLGPKDNEARAAVTIEMNEYFRALLDDRRLEPRDDLATLVVQAEIDGARVPDDLQRGYLLLLILAGIDTTWSAIGSGLWHLGTNPADRDRLVGPDDADDLWTTATEEVLRFYAPVTMARRIMADGEVAGCPVRAGEQMLLPFPAANHDPAAFDEPERFVIDRQVNRHVAFGVGIHRCIGSNLARLELRVALQEWMRAFPGFVVDGSRPTTWSNGQVRGPRRIPVLLR